MGLGSEDADVRLGEAVVRIGWHDPVCRDPLTEDAASESQQVDTVPHDPLTGLPDIAVSFDQAAALVCRLEDTPSAPNRVSYTGLHLFDECPFRYYVSYVLGLRRLERADAGALDIGTSVHRALEHEDPARAIERIAMQEGLDEQQASRVHDAVAAFLGSRTAQAVASSNRVYRERPFALRLGDTRLEGQIDLIAHTGSSALIVDYKTGQDRDASLSKERLRGYELQSLCYALPALETGAQEVEVRFVFVEQGCHEVVHTHDASQAAAIRTALTERVERMASGDYPWLAKRNERMCPGCVAQGLCPHAPVKRCFS
jgi:RecB family exonuclease